MMGTKRFLLSPLLGLFILITKSTVIDSKFSLPSSSPTSNPYYRNHPPPPANQGGYPYGQEDSFNNDDPYYYDQDQYPSSSSPTSSYSKYKNNPNINDGDYSTESIKSSKRQTRSRKSEQGDYDDDYDMDFSSRSRDDEIKTTRVNKTKPKKEYDIIVKYTKSVLSCILVAFSASVFIFLLTNIIVSFTISSIPYYVTFSIALVGFIATFIPNDIGNFSRSSGVFLILLLQQNQHFLTFCMRLCQYMLAVLMLTKRKGFPHIGDPWKYKPYSIDRRSSRGRVAADIDDRDDDMMSNQLSPPPPMVIENYSMMKIIIASVILGGMIGRLIAKPIPLFPNWIGSLLGAGFLAYVSTMGDTRGDITRYVCKTHCMCAVCYSLLGCLTYCVCD